MKRKSKVQTNTNNPQVTFVLRKIDDAVEALQKNEDQIAKVLGALAERELSEDERDTLRKAYNTYTKGTESLKKKIER